ncbi:SMC-Scp complex subunit ScpB [Bdellovibrio bacteriovorus]|uniref:SMC-Scp complex subunit ScpB n=1 Tax=Bdellovibrio bacteriovorus TaxID=959 RepID=UPI000B0A34D5|nr:SMC-Scp complex subunit ScpB [Bdellovibrio bacteriovorus]
MARKKGKKSSQVEETEVLESVAEVTENTDVAVETSEAESADEVIAESIMETEIENEEVSFEDGIESETSIFLQEEEESEGFLPEGDESETEEMEMSEEDEVSLEGTELDGFDSAEIEEIEFVEDERLESIVESVLFASDRPVSMASLKLLFKGTNIKTNHLRRTLDQLAVEYAGGRRGVTLEEVPGGFQLRTKIDNMDFLKRTLKARQFKLSGPALEVLSIVAYKQPTVKFEVDEIRGVESGHLLRALMEKNLVCFEGKSDLPGRPMQYGTTKKFLEIFGLRSIKELPTLSQIDELLPEGIDEEQAEEKPKLASLTDSLSQEVVTSYSQGEEELMKIQEQLEEITTTSNFFEEEKRRQAEKRDQEKAQNIRDALAFGEPVSTRDANWLKKYDEALAAGTTLVAIAAEKKAAFMGQRPQNAGDAVAGVEAAQVDGAEAATSEEESLEQELAAAEAAMSDDEEETMEVAGNDDDGEVSEELADALEAFDNDEDLEDASDDSSPLLADDESSDDDELPFFGEADEIDEEGETTT